MSTIAPTSPLSPPSTSPASPSRVPRVMLAAWPAAATLLAASGIITVERPLLVPAVLLTTVVTLLVAHRRSPAVRELAAQVSTRAVLAYQAIRAPIGLAFLVLEARGALTGAFAHVAGWGDLLVGVAALPLLALSDRTLARQRGWLLAWNVVGLADILLVVLNAQRLILTGQAAGLRGLIGFPGLLLPTLIVPLVITSHLLLLSRLRREGQGVSTSPSTTSSSISSR